MSGQSHWRAYGLLVFTTWCWGLNTIFSRMAVGEISPMQLVMFRWLGVIAFLVVFTREYLFQDWPILRRHLFFLSVMGALGFTLFNYLFYLAGYYTTALNIGILQGSLPVFVLLGSFLILRQGITVIQAVGVIITLLGVLIIATGGNLFELQELSLNRGDLYILIACSLYAIYSIGLSRRPDVRALSLFTVMSIAAWVVSLPLLGLEIAQQGWQTPTPKGWIIALVVIILPSLVAQIFFIQSVALIGPSRAGVFINLVPVFAAIMAVMFLQETFEQYHAFSLALVVGGIALSEFGRPRETLEVPSKS